jgi:KipI family sensor histidine kinase inhibitor
MNEVRLLRAGDRGALLEFPDNSTAVRVARALAGTSGRFVDVVPGHRTVLVTWTNDAEQEDLLAVAEAALDAREEREPGKDVEIPVAYGGPDLEYVARHAGLSAEELAARHLAAEYVVAFLGFAPGFAYLLGGDDRLNVPRLNEPRERVPSGSVALGGPYSGIYPRETPGGWRIIGRTTVTLFDPALMPPALLAAGDRVRFVVA